MKLPEPGWLGFGFHFHHAEQPDGSLPRWLEVCGVAPGGPAAAVGLQLGDVIFEIDGEALPFQDVRGALAFFAKRQPGEKVRLTVRRGPLEISIMLVVAEMAEEQRRLWRENLAREATPISPPGLLPSP